MELQPHMSPEPDPVTHSSHRSMKEKGWPDIENFAGEKAGMMPTGKHHVIFQPKRLPRPQ